MGFKPRQPSERQLWETLGKRPKQVALLLMRGDLTMEDIATELGITDKTVYHHRDSAMKALGLASNAQVVHFGLRLGLLKVMPRP